MLNFQDESARTAFKAKIKDILTSFKNKKLKESEVRILYGLRETNVFKNEMLKSKHDLKHSKDH